MEKQKKLLLIGDKEGAPYHPLTLVEHQLKSILVGEYAVKHLVHGYDIDVVEDYLNMSYEQISKYDAVISYTDCWKSTPNTGFTASLITYVVNGGALLMLHNGISLQSSYELAQMFGAKFISHPPQANLKYMDFNKKHPIMDGVFEFELYEEPYQFEFDPFTEKTILFQYLYENQKYIAAWTQDYGLGKVIYLSPGHDSSIFECDNYRKIILNSVVWMVK